MFSQSKPQPGDAHQLKVSREVWHQLHAVVFDEKYCCQNWYVEMINSKKSVKPEQRLGLQRLTN